MSKRSHLAFLKRLDRELKKSSDKYREETANKLVHFVSIQRGTINKVIRAAIKSSTNVKGDPLSQKGIESKYNALLSVFMEQVGQNFRALEASSTKNDSNVKVLRQGPHFIKVEIEEGKGRKRDNFDKAQNNYKRELNTLYEGVLNLLGEASLDRIGSEGQTIEQSNSGQVFNLEHFRDSSNVLLFINDALYNALKNMSKDNKALVRRDSPELFLSLQADFEAERVDVFLGSQAKNVKESSKERAEKRDLEKALEEAIKRVKGLPDVKGSDSLREVKEKQALEAAIKPFKGKKNHKVTSNKTKLDTSKRKTKQDVSPSVKAGKGLSSKGLKKKRIRKKAVKGVASTPLALIASLNKALPEAVQDNMGSPALVYRTGRFAQSVHVTDIMTTKTGLPSIGYTYQREPYSVFEKSSGSRFASEDRDPRKLIDKSIRDIAAGLAIGRFFTRRT